MFEKIAFRNSLLVLFMIIFSNNLLAQCCAGGSGSPIAGGASQGVLMERQFDLNTNFQFIKTDKFYSKDSPDTARTFDGFESIYEYFRVAYGVSKNFTISVESGYYVEKKEIGLDNNPATTYKSSGFGDLIIFPRYDIINRTREKTRTEVTLGLGYKIPLGSYNDSTGNVEPFSGETYYVTKPTAVQLSSGAPDIIFYTFLYHGFTERNFRIFANAFYIKKNFNPAGEKLGDFGSIAVFAGHTFLKDFGATLQARYEWVERMEINENVLLYGRPTTYYPEATGYKKVFITPQLNFTKGKFTIYGSMDLPVYQYLNTSEFYTQVGSEHQYTFGISYRFFVKNDTAKKHTGSGKYYCPMHPEQTSDVPAKCPICQMDLEKAK